MKNAVGQQLMGKRLVFHLLAIQSATTVASGQGILEEILNFLDQEGTNTTPIITTPTTTTANTVPTTTIIQL